MDIEQEIDYLTSPSEQELILMLLDEGSITMEDVEKALLKKKKEYVLKRHKYKITLDKTGRFRTHYRRPGDPSIKRISIVKRNEDRFYSALYDLYTGREERFRKRMVSLEEIKDDWLEYKRLHGISEATIIKYESDWKCHLKGTDIVNRPICTLNKHYLDVWAHELIRDNNMTRKSLDKGRKRQSMPYGYYTNSHRLCGYLFCADCGHRMSINHHKRKDGSDVFSFRCGNYSNNGKNCTAHYIAANTIEKLLLQAIQRLSRRVIKDENVFAASLKEAYEQELKKRPVANRSKLKESEKRFDELDRLIRSLYENYSKGVLPERQYLSIMKSYAEEQDALEKQIAELKAEAVESDPPAFKGDRFIEIVKKYKNPTELTDEMLRELVDKVLVHEKVKEEDKTSQRRIIIQMCCTKGAEKKKAITHSDKRIA